MGEYRVHPELRQLVLEASQALARLDADRLEELALSCQALSRNLPGLDALKRAALARQAREAAPEMAVFGCVLEATRANLDVIERLTERGCGLVEYGGWCGPPSNGSGTLTERIDGND